MSRVVAAQDLLAAAGLGALINFPWEAAHSLLYRGKSMFTWGEHLVCCGLASLADGVGIAVLFGIGAMVFCDPRWTRYLSPARLGLADLLGLAGALLVERLALRLDWWGYGPAMPRVPGTELGVTPLLQFLVLPSLVLFWALPRWWKYRGSPQNMESERAGRRMATSPKLLEPGQEGGV